MPLSLPTVDVHPGYVAGRFYWANNGISIAAGLINGQNTIKLLPFMLEKPITVSDLATRVNTLAVAGNIQIAIYAADPITKMPTGNALGATGNISTTTISVVSAAIAGGNIVLAAGQVYWAAVNADNATVITTGPGMTGILAGYFIGTTTLATLQSAATSASLCYSVAQAFGTWPSLTAASFTEVTTAMGGPVIALKAA